MSGQQHILVFRFLAEPADVYFGGKVHGGALLKLLDEVARVLVEAPALTKVQVEGHTDWYGALEYNDTLSQARAQSVVDYLENRGVAPGRLVAMGYGERRPLVDGPAGRREPGLSMNRRVEFVILEVDGKPHGPDKPVILDQVP